MAQPSGYRSFSRKTRFLLPNSCFGYPVADIMSCRGLCSCDDGCFFCNPPPSANLHMYMCRLDEKSLHTWTGRVIEATKIACVCVCVLKGVVLAHLSPPHPDKAGHYSQMVVCSLRPCVWCVIMDKDRESKLENCK